jgi:hypothetical protein
MHLPADTYEVHIENEMDARRLKYLAEQVGARKVAASARKYAQRYPGSKIYVSTLLRWYRIRVPAHIFAPVNVPLYRVYLLLHEPTGRIKIGCSGNWLQRIQNFSADHGLDDFDLDRSVGISFLGDKQTARKAELASLKTFMDFGAEEPEYIPFGAGGRTEWFQGVIYGAAFEAIATFDATSRRPFITLRQAIATTCNG